MSGKRITQKDVARAAGVSHAAVSLVLAGRNFSIRPEVRERILATARELGYTPNLAAQALATRQRRIIGLACRGALPTAVADQLIREAEALGCQIHLLPSGQEAADLIWDGDAFWIRGKKVATISAEVLEVILA